MNLHSQQSFHQGRVVYQQSKGALLRRSLLTSLLALLCTVCASMPAHAQVAAHIKGVVTDASGAAMPSASVEVKNVETGAVRSTATDDAGRYLVLSLALGDYEIRASKAGFKEVVRTGGAPDCWRRGQRRSALTDFFGEG